MVGKDFQNIHAMLRENAEASPDAVAFRWFSGERETASVSWAEFYQLARKVARALIALGMSPGDRAGVLSYTCFRWVAADAGILLCGGTTVGIYQASLAKDVQHLARQSEARVVFVQDENQLAKLREIRENLAGVTRVILMHGEHDGDPWIMSWDDFLALAGEVPEADLDARSLAVKPSDTAAIVYTPGTTGMARGAVLTHDNFLFTTRSVGQCLPIREGDVSFLFLPLAHVFGKMWVWMSIASRICTHFGRSMATAIEDMAEVSPHFFASVPRIFEKVRSRALADSEAKGGLSHRLFLWALGLGRRVSEARLTGKEAPLLTRILYFLAGKTLLGPISRAFGKSLRFCVSGAAPLAPELGRFFHAAGVLILEGIGMTENTSFSHVNREDDFRFGWVGKPGPGISHKRAEDGELLIRGRNVMKSYLHMPEETRQALDDEGFLHTGDLCEIDETGFVRITGRKKDLLITAGGRNVAPSAIEGVLCTSPYIFQACVVGDRRKYLSALVTLEAKNVERWARDHGLSFQNLTGLSQNEKVKELIRAEVASCSAEFPPADAVKSFAIVPEFTVDGGLLTPTLKIKRPSIEERYDSLIKSLYPQE
ncbi:MAG: long-chain fatty acid--CoA ligase [Thermodesulfobacteriota bacterium]